MLPRKPPIFLKGGDEVVVEVDRIKGAGWSGEFPAAVAKSPTSRGVLWSVLRHGNARVRQWACLALEQSCYVHASPRERD